MEIPKGCPQADVSANSGVCPEVSRAFLAMLIFCTKYFHNDVLSPFHQSLTPHFQMFTLPTQDQTLCRETTHTETAEFPPFAVPGSVIDPNLATNLQLGMWLKPDALPSTLSTLNCINLLPDHFPLLSFQTAAGASQQLSQEGFAGKAQLTQTSQLHKPENPIVSCSSSWWGAGVQPGNLGADKVFLDFSFPLSFMGCGSEDHCILLSLLGIYIEVCAILSTIGLILHRQWHLKALVLPITIENVVTEVCGKFYFQTFFSLKL